MEKVTAKKTGLALLREPFEKHQISKLPKPTKQQTDDVRLDFSKGIRCDICGGWHHPKVVHLDYVGHAALTDRLLDADEKWNWKPLSTTPAGFPAFDDRGGLWIELTVDGVSRLGYGNAEGKQGGDAVKEIIGDALRNAGMRFGAALDLWHKGDLHKDDDAPAAQPQHQTAVVSRPQTTAPKAPAPQPVIDVPLADYVMTCGNNNVRGRKLSEIDNHILEDSVAFFTKGAPAIGHVAVSIGKAQEWLTNCGTTLNNNDEIPF